MPKKDHAVYIISVAADLAGVHPQTLRIYERKGLLRPERTAGNTRRYSGADIERLQRIQTLTQDQGINLAGVKMILELEAQLDRMRKQLERMADRVQGLESSLADQMRAMSREASAILPRSSHRTLQELLEEAQRRSRKPIAVGPVRTKTKTWTSTG